MSTSFKFFALIVTLVVAAVGEPAPPVLGGEDAKEKQFPYQVSIQMEGSHFCAGSILNERYILTASHCMYGADGEKPASDLLVRAGSLKWSEGGDLLKVKRITMHGDNANFKNDVTLLELDEPLKFSDTIQPIEMSKDLVPSGADVIVSGWGVTNDSVLSKHLQWTTLKAISKEECSEHLSETKYELNNILCLAHKKDNGVCSGDSGGPGVYNGKLVGVASFVVGICASPSPNGYARISKHYDWIVNNMKN
uniref:Peptidase S1 domain-containing protein n=1 Tax=Glossina brevipalpis TaxID=37001 RepID=A0A1A9WAU3_9MUSC